MKVPFLLFERNRTSERGDLVPHFRCTACGEVVVGRQAAVPHAKWHERAGMAEIIRGQRSERVELRYAISPSGASVPRETDTHAEETS